MENEKQISLVEKRKIYRAKNRERNLKFQKEYYRKNREKISERRKELRQQRKNLGIDIALPKRKHSNKIQIEEIINPLITEDYYLQLKHQMRFNEEETRTILEELKHIGEIS